MGAPICLKSPALPTELPFHTLLQLLSNFLHYPLRLVPKVGLEPTHLAILDFESSASTSFTTRAVRIALHHVAYLTSINFVLPLFFTCFSVFFTTLYFLVPQAGLEPALVLGI